MQTNTKSVAELTKRLIAMLTADENGKPKFQDSPGVLLNFSPPQIDDGGGYSGEFDGRPDFVRKDDEGWQRLT